MTKLIIWILIPIALIFAGLLATMLYHASIKKRKDKALNELHVSIKKERMTKINNTLSRVKRISNDNPKYKELFEVLTTLHTEIDTKLNSIVREAGVLTLEIKKIKLNDFLSQIDFIETDISKMDRLQHKYEVEAERVIQQDDFLNSEFTFYGSNLRKTISVYRDKRILLDRIAPKLDDLSKSLKRSGKQFNVNLDAANIKGATLSLQEYSRNVILFSEIVNEGPSIQTYLFITIPTLVKNLVKKYKDKKIEMSGTLEHVDFKNSIEAISKKFKKSRDYYLNLKLEKSKALIRNILKSLKILERLINQEINSRNAFIQNYEKVIAEAKKVLTNFVTIKKQIQDLAGRGIQIPLELSDTYNQIKRDAKEIDSEAIKFREVMMIKTIAYSAKLSRMKLLLKKINSFIILLNNATASVWILNVENLIIKNKFRRAEAALNEVIANVKINKIQLTVEEEEKFSEISQELSKLAPKVSSDDTSTELSKKVNDLVEKTINYYQMVGGKIQIVQIVKNLIKEFSPKRAIDLDLNTQFSIAESRFLRGEYDAALSTIIEHLEEARH